jgi:hypothetical protein
MKYIDLFIQKFKKEENSTQPQALYVLSDVIKNQKVSIVLGSPGSGKTSILNKYAEDFSDKSQFVTVNSFLNERFNVRENIKYLLLDGLDEYKSISQNKSSVIENIGYKIKELKNVKTVITCRQADWFGNSDTEALNSIVTENVEVYKLSKLDRTKKEELANSFGINNSYEFINKFDEYGFLENPQMFRMIAKLYISDTYTEINSKSDLYYKFITYAKEKNQFYSNNQKNELEIDELLKGVGYISLFYIFTGVEVFDDEYQTQIASSEIGINKKLLRKVLNTNLFDAEQFIHRTIAEYAAAYYLSKYKVTSIEGIQFERLKSLFTVNTKVPTVLRGTFAWLCSLTKDKNLLSVDPYNLLLNGDCDSFPPSLKKELLKSVKDLSTVNPNFVRGGDYYGFRPSEFYHPDLDDYILSSINNISTINSGFEYLIYKILESAKNLSNRMFNYLKIQFLDTTVENPIRYRLIKIFKNNSVLLLKVLNKIKHGSIKRNERVIDRLLDYLYPKTINHLQVVDYLLLYDTYVLGHLRFLEKTKYNDKMALVDLIFKEIFRNNEINNHLTKMVNYFINDYLVETVLEYEKSLTAKEIYHIISDFRSYGTFESFIELKFKFESFKPELNLNTETNQKKLTKLWDELFDIFVSDKLKQKQLPWFHNFQRMFDRFSRPTNIPTILLNHIHSNNSEEQNQHLYLEALNFLPKHQELDADMKNKIEDLAIKYKFKKNLELYKTPVKPSWEIEDDKRTIEAAIENQLKIDKNEAYFAKLTDVEISKDVGILYKIAQKLFIARHYQITESNLLTDKTFARLKGILKNLIYKPLNSGYENLKSLAESNTGITTIRPIDITYYASCSLNLEFTKKIRNIELCKYLYILCKCKSKLGNDIIKGAFLENIEYLGINEVETLKEYYRFMLDEKLPSYSDIIENYIRHENSKSRLINLSILSFNDNTTGANHILNAFIRSYLFEIEKNDLNELIDYKDMDTTNKSIINVLIAVKETTKKISEEDARCFFSLFSFDKKYFDSFLQTQKVKLIDLFMSSIDKPQSIIDAHYDEFGDFISRNGIYSLDLKSIEKLYQKRNTKHDSWSDLLLQVRDELKQKQADRDHHPHSIQNLREYLLRDSILDKKDFFTDVCLKIKAIKDDIEANRDQQKNLYYDLATPKTENNCRDALLIRLKDKYGVEFELSPEKQEAENTRVDINVKYKSNIDYEVQIECKRDRNTPDIYTGIPNQLIEKYLSKNVEYGIYLIFYFGYLKNKSLLLKKIKNSLPKEYENKIEIIFIDLTYGAK